MTPLRIAFFPLIRSTFDVPLAEEMIRQAREHLLAAGFELIEPETPICDLSQARIMLQNQLLNDVDLLLVFQATFADSTMVTTLVENFKAPVFLWAIPEDWTGGRLRLNSLCGINLAGHALKLSGKKYEYGYGQPDDGSIISSIRSLAMASNFSRRLSSARLGVIGEHPSGMDSCNLDEPRIKSVFGIQIQHIALDDVFSRARRISKEKLDSVRTELDEILDNLDTLQQKPLSGTLSVYSALKEISEEQKLDGLAVRCWPEFFTELGCAACGAMSMLSEGFGGITPLPCSCEADINGTITQLILQWLSNSPAFGTDMVAVDKDKDQMALWHCGLAPFSMADPKSKLQGGNHSNRGVPLVMDFPLRPGKVTIARVSQATGEFRMVIGQGEVLTSPKPFSGTSGILRLNHPISQFLDTLMFEGLEHHISIVYGDYIRELKTYASLISLPILSL